MSENITPKDAIDFIEKIRNIFPGNSYRYINLESYYNQLIEKQNRSDEEEFFLEAISHNRKFEIIFINRINEYNIDLPEKFKNKFVHKPKYYDWNTKPIKIWEYNILYTYFPKHIGDELINGYRVSTIWLGLNMSFWPNNDPVIFETMIFKENEELPKNEELDNYQVRYSHLAEAEKGHKVVCDFVRERTK